MDVSMNRLPRKDIKEISQLFLVSPSAIERVGELCVEKGYFTRGDWVVMISKASQMQFEKMSRLASAILDALRNNSRVTVQIFCELLDQARGAIAARSIRQFMQQGHTTDTSIGAHEPAFQQNSLKNFSTSPEVFHFELENEKERFRAMDLFEPSYQHSKEVLILVASADTSDFWQRFAAHIGLNINPRTLQQIQEAAKNRRVSPMISVVNKHAAECENNGDYYSAKNFLSDVIALAEKEPKNNQVLDAARNLSSLIFISELKTKEIKQASNALDQWIERNNLGHLKTRDGRTFAEIVEHEWDMHEVEELRGVKDHHITQVGFALGPALKITQAIEKIQ